MNPRGVGASRGELDGLTLYDLATDVAGVIDHVGGSAHLVGRAFGNRVARMVATSYPGRVRSVVLLAAGGLFAPNRSEPGPEARLRSELRLWRDAARSQHAASRRTDVADWWNGGIAPTLVIQGLDDRAAPPENGRALAAEHPGRVRLVEIERAGHNPMADQPEIVIPQIVAFLQEMEQTSSAGS